MRILLPKKTTADWQDLVKQVAACKPMKPFDELTLSFLQQVANTIMNDKRFINYPETNVLVESMQGPHMNTLKGIYDSRSQGRILLPRGVALHFIPSNLDSVFFASWLTSLVLGNKNIIRISEKGSTQMQLLFDILDDVLGQEHFKMLRERNLVVSYGHDDEINKELSRFCHVRLIWGGDETVSQIRAVPLPPRATELVFADRFSMAAINAEAVLTSSDQEIEQLAKNFHKDAFMYNQMVCSSTKVLFWIGKGESIRNAKCRFWGAVDKIIAAERSNSIEGGSFDPMVAAYTFVAQGIADKVSPPIVGSPYRVHLQDFKEGLREMHKGGGLFWKRRDWN